jgi:hypothetical protein
MAQLRLLFALVAALYFFLDLSFAAGRFGQRQRKQISRNEQEASKYNKQKLAETVESTSNFRFYNKNTSRKLVMFDFDINAYVV